MGTQLSFITKEDAHKYIDALPGDGVFVLTYSEKTGKSDTGKFIKKKKGNKLVDKAKVVVLSENKITTLNLHDVFFNSFDDYKRKGTIKTIMIPKLE